MFLEGLRVTQVKPAEFMQISRMFLGWDVRLGPNLNLASDVTEDVALQEICRQLSNELVLKCCDYHGQILGAIRGEVDGKGLHITGMAISRRHRGLGLGKVLVFHLEQASRQKHYSAYVLENDSQGLALYQGALYQVVEALDLEAGYKMVRLDKRGGGWASKVL